MYASMSLCVYIWECICVYAHEYMSMYMWYICICLSDYVCVCACLCACMHACAIVFWWYHFASCFLCSKHRVLQECRDGAMISWVLTKEWKAEERDETQKERDKDRARQAQRGLGHQGLSLATQHLSLWDLLFHAWPLLYWVSFLFFFKNQGSSTTWASHVALSESMS